MWEILRTWHMVSPIWGLGLLKLFSAHDTHSEKNRADLSIKNWGYESMRSRYYIMGVLFGIESS